MNAQRCGCPCGCPFNRASWATVCPACYAGRHKPAKLF